MVYQEMVPMDSLSQEILMKLLKYYDHQQTPHNTDSPMGGCSLSGKENFSVPSAFEKKQTLSDQKNSDEKKQILSALLILSRQPALSLLSENKLDQNSLDRHISYLKKCGCSSRDYNRVYKDWLRILKQK
jgi:hypothetical protein